MGIKEDLEKAASQLGVQKRIVDQQALKKELDLIKGAQLHENNVKIRDKYLEELYGLIYSSGYISQATNELTKFLNTNLDPNHQTWNLVDINGSSLRTWNAWDDDMTGSGDAGQEATNYKGKLLYKRNGYTTDTYIKSFADALRNKYTTDIVSYDLEELFVGFVYNSHSEEQDFSHNCGSLTFIHRDSKKISSMDKVSKLSYQDFIHDSNFGPIEQESIHFGLGAKGYFREAVVEEINKLSGLLDNPSNRNGIKKKIDDKLVSFAARNIIDFPKL